MALGEGLPPGLSGMKGGLKLPMLAAMKAPEKGDPSKLLGVVGPPTWLGSEVVGGVGSLRICPKKDCFGGFPNTLCVKGSSLGGSIKI